MPFGHFNMAPWCLVNSRVFLGHSYVYRLESQLPLDWPPAILHLFTMRSKEASTQASTPAPTFSWHSGALHNERPRLLHFQRALHNELADCSVKRKIWSRAWTIASQWKHSYPMKGVNDTRNAKGLAKRAARITEYEDVPANGKPVLQICNARKLLDGMPARTFSP